MSALTLILGDQLTPDLSSLSDFNPSTDTVLMAEVMEEATYVGHHKKKLAFVFSAMRHFAEELEATGVAVRYVKLTDPENEGSLRGEVARALDADPGIDTLIMFNDKHGKTQFPGQHIVLLYNNILNITLHKIRSLRCTRNA